MSGTNRPPLSETVLALVDVYEEVRQLAKRRCPRGSDTAEDLLHNIYVTVFERPPLSVGKPKAYLARALANGIVSSARRKEREPVHLDTQKLRRIYETRPEMHRRDMADETAAERELLELVKQLPPHLAATLVLVKRDGWNYQETAAALGVSVATIKRNLARATALCLRMDAKAKRRGRGK